jgi:hypothetical protein
MAEIFKPSGLCCMGCRRPATHRKMYCEWCYNTLRRGGFDKVPHRVRVRAARDPKTGQIIRKQHYRIQWKNNRNPGFLTVKEIRQTDDPRPRCIDPGCTNLARRKNLCDAHHPLAKARKERYKPLYRARYAERGTKYRPKSDQRKAA